LSHVLTSAGYDVWTASGGEPAIAMVEARLPDLILLDIRMPGMDGFDVLRTLKGQEKSRNVPILLISAFAETDERIEGLRLGAEDSVTKPFHAGELLARVRMQLELSGLRARHASHEAVLNAANEELKSEIARRERAEAALQSRLLALTQPAENPDGIRFSDLINIEDLQQLQDQFSNATGVASIITEPDGTPITKASNFCRLCSEIIRATEIGLRNCQQSDAALGIPCSAGPIVQPCLSGGLWDAGASITVGGKHIANWLIGQVRNEEQDEEQMLRYADEIGTDREEFRAALAEVPVMSKARFEQTAKALFTFAREISSRAFQNLQQARFIAERQQAEQELKKSEARLSFALETLTAGAWDLDLVDHTAHRTLLHDRIFGYETLLPAWTYEIFLEHVLPEDRADVDRCFREATEAHCDWGFECRIRRTDGEVRWIWATGSHERNAEGKPVRMSGIVQDITDRRAVEQSLRENETSLAITLQSIGDAVIATDVNGRITRMNPVAERLTGWPLAEAEGRPLAEVFRIVNAQTRQPVEDPVGQVIERGVTVGLANHTVLLARDGKEYQIADSAAPIRDPYGEIFGVVLVFSDVTESYGMQEALLQKGAEYERLLEHLPAGVVVHAGDSAIVLGNSMASSLLGLTKDQMLGKTAMDPAWCFLREDATRAPFDEYPVQQVLASGAPIRSQIFGISRPDMASPLWVLCNAYPEKDVDGKISRVVVTFIDITERKTGEVRVARLSQLYAALSQCNQAIVHSDSPDELLPEVCRLVVEFGGMKMAWIGMVDEAAGMVLPVAAYGSGTDHVQGIRISTDKRETCTQGLTGRSIRENRPVWCQDFQNDPSYAPWNERNARFGWAAGAAFPLRKSGKSIGTLVAYSDKAHVFDDEVRKLLEEMADDISFALESFDNEAERRRAEQALIESEETMRYIVKHDPNALAVFDNGLRYIAVSDRFLKNYNVREADVLGRHHYEVFPEIPRVWREVHQRCLAGAVERNDDDSFERPDGSITYNRWECRPWYRKGGEIGGIVMYTEVTTERKRQEENLRMMSEMLDAAPCSITVHDLEGRFFYANRRTSRLHGYEHEELMSLALRDLDAPESRAVLEDRIRLVEEQGEAAFEVVHCRKDGSTFPLEVVAKKVAWGGNQAILGISSDITERKTTENALRESEERFRLMLQHIPSISVQGYYMDGTTHYWNDASEALYGYSREEALGKSLLDLIIPPEMRDGVRQAIKTMGETLQPPPASELTLMRKDGSRVTVFSSHAVISRHGREPEFFCIDIDLTERKLAENALKELNAFLEESNVRAKELAIKAEAAAQAKSEFLALMSHELRTPLNGVLGFAELLSRTRLDEEQQEYTQTIFDSGTHLLDVVNDILDLASLEKGRMLLETAPINISSLVESACRLIRKTAADKGLVFSFESSPEVPEVITGDMRRIRQILINLLGNAVKFTQKGSVVLRVAAASAGGRRALDFSVEDTGPGIPNEILEDLFKPFTQADSSVSRPFEGTGLGLTISLRLAEAMGGTLSVVSTPGHGSRFTFRYPLETASPALASRGTGGAPVLEQDTAAGSIFSSEIEPMLPEGSLILVVEDEPSNRVLVSKMLEHLGYGVETAVTGLEALESFSPGKYAAILMDMQMPVMDGLEATRRIRQRESGTRVPIIALTANVLPGDRERCLSSGMDEFLTKPFNLRNLSDKLAVFLKA